MHVSSYKNSNNKKIESQLDYMNKLDPRLNSVLYLFKHTYFINTIRKVLSNYEFFNGVNPIYNILPRL